MVLPLQLTAPWTSGSTWSAPEAVSASTGSLKTISRLVVMSATPGSPSTGWVRLTSSTWGARASIVLATYRTPARTNPPTPMTRRLRRITDRIGAATDGR